MQKSGIINKVIITVLLSILIAYGYTYFTNGCCSAKANVFGYKLVYVGSESMEPTINTGAVVLCKMIDQDDIIQNGDICNYIFTYNNIEKTVIHRVIYNDNQQYIFKGDNNSKEDFLPVNREQICSRYLFTIYNAK